MQGRFFCGTFEEKHSYEPPEGVRGEPDDPLGGFQHSRQKAGCRGADPEAGRGEAGGGTDHEGQVQLSGTLEVHILYVSEGDERRLCRIQAEFPFEEKLLLPGAAAGDSVDVRQELEDLKVRLINSRKFSVQALISFEAELEELYDVQAGVELHGEASISTRSTRVTPISLAVRNKDIIRGEGGTFPSLQQAQHRRDSVGQRGASGRGCAGSGRVSGYQGRTFPLPSL